MSAVEGWITKRFDEIGTIFSGSTPSTSIHAFWNGEIVWVTPYDLSRLNSPYLSDSAKRITMKGLSGCSAHLLPAGSIVMSSRAPIGYVALPTVEFCTNQGCKSIQLKNNFTSEFTYYNILFNIDKVKNLGEGTTFAEISKTALSKIELDFPQSKPEQTKIAEILSTVDRAIEQTEALIAKQQRIKTGLMQDLLTRGIDEHGNLRSEQTHEFKDSPLGRIPVEWEVKPLGQVSNLITNGFVGVATPHYTESSDGIPYLYGNNIRSNHIDIKNVTFINQKFHSRQHKSQLLPGDMLTVQSGHIGTTAIVTESLGASNCHALIITKFKKDILNPHFVSFYCNFCLETGSMSHLFIGSTIKHINTSDFAKFAIPFPSKKEQSNIAERLFKIGRNSYATEANLAKLRSLKTALMQDLLTGKKRVTILLKDTEEQAYE